jgi:PEP-CTERM motif
MGGCLSAFFTLERRTRPRLTAEPVLNQVITSAGAAFAVACGTVIKGMHMKNMLWVLLAMVAVVSLGATPAHAGQTCKVVPSMCPPAPGGGGATSVPEPASLLVLAMGAGAAAIAARRRKKK